MIDLAPHRRRLAIDRFGEIGHARRGGVGDDGERRLQRVGEVAGVAARLLGLDLVMLEQGVQLLDQGLDLQRQPFLDPRLLPGPDRGDGATHAAQRPEAVDRLQRGEHDQAEAEDRRTSAPGCGAARRSARPASRLCATWNRQRTGEPGSRTSRSATRSRSIGNSSVSRKWTSSSVWAWPGDRRRSQSERDGKRSNPLSADLIIEAGIGLEELLVGGLAVEQHLAFRPDLRRGDHRGQHIIELGVEIVGDRRGQHPVQREAAAAEQHRDPDAGDDDHPPGQRSRRPAALGTPRPEVRQLHLALTTGRGSCGLAR